MTWSYDPTDLATNPVDEVRLYVQDTQTDRQLLQNEEINFLLTAYGVNYSLPALAIAALAADIIAARFAARTNISADGVSISSGNLAQQYQTLAARLREQYEEQAGVGVEPYAGGILLWECPDFDVKPHEFAIGMNDNPEGYAQAAWADGYGWGYGYGLGYWGEEW